MMPMVFCASLEPCENAMKLAERTWSHLKVRLTFDGGRRCTIQRRTIMKMRAATRQMAGAAIMGTMTLSTRPLQITPLMPTWTSVAPTSPPISACDELDGMPKRHVMRFQAMAPMSAARTTTCVTSSESTMPPPIVLATLVDTKAPSRLRTAAMMTATRGDRARVETEVAMALAVSWKPLVKSKISAMATMVMRSAIYPRSHTGDWVVLVLGIGSGGSAVTGRRVCTRPVLAFC